MQPTIAWNWTGLIFFFYMLGSSVSESATGAKEVVIQGDVMFELPALLMSEFKVRAADSICSHVLFCITARSLQIEINPTSIIFSNLMAQYILSRINLDCCIRNFFRGRRRRIDETFCMTIFTFSSKKQAWRYSNNITLSGSSQFNFFFWYLKLCRNYVTKLSITANFFLVLN